MITDTFRTHFNVAGLYGRRIVPRWGYKRAVSYDILDIFFIQAHLTGDFFHINNVLFTPS